MISAQQELLAAQFRFLKGLKSMKESKLRKKHKETFATSKYNVKVPKWMHRSIIERRLFYYYALRNYHYPREHQIAQEFRRKARFILSPDYILGIDRVEDARQRLKQASYFTATNIKAMPIAEVDRYLTGLSLFLECSEDMRRKVLWEWFNKPVGELVDHFGTRSRMRKVRRGNLNNGFKLLDLILENPRMGYDDFMETFGAQMPTATRNSFNNTRCLLRKAGYDIATLPKGPHRPAVVVGPYGHQQRARMLNDTTLQGVTDGEEQESEPF